MAHKNYKGLRDGIMQMAKEGMRTHVHDDISTQMQSNINREVYSKYNPLEYHERRKFNNGGLGDKNSIKGTTFDVGNGFVYRLRNEATGYNRPSLYLTPLIVLGQLTSIIKGYSLLHDKIASYDKMRSIPQPTDFEPYYEPRDFISPTKQYVRGQSQQLTKKLESFMSR